MPPDRTLRAAPPPVAHPRTMAATTRRAGASHREVTVQDILDAIMAAEGAKDPARELAGIGGLPVPESYQGVVVRADEQNMFDGLASRDQDPRKSLHVQEVPTPELGPGEALVAVMASAINYNTVWTSIFQPVSTFKFLQRYGRQLRADQAPRPAVPRGRLGRRRRGPAGRRRRDQVEARRPGRGALPLGGARGRRRPRRHDARPAAADLGLRDQLRRPGRAGDRQGQPADAQAGPPDLGGGRLPGAGQLHRVPAAGLAPRRAT